jgi:hypothetical protein
MYAPQPPRHSFVRGILVTLATTVFGFSLLLNLYLLVFSGLMSGAGSSPRTEVIRQGDRLQQVAVVPIKGVIMDDMAETFDRLLKKA